MGSNLEYPIDVRIIVASKPDLEKRVARGIFLEDLYFRIQHLRIDVPPLRARPTDVAPLVAHFSDRFEGEYGRKVRLRQRALKLLEEYSWPGNVRELEGVLSRLFVESESDAVDASQVEEHLPSSAKRGNPAGTFAEFALRQERERQHFILETLSRAKSTSRAARQLGLPDSTLRSMLGKMNLRENPVSNHISE